MESFCFFVGLPLHVEGTSREDANEKCSRYHPESHLAHISTEKIYQGVLKYLENVVENSPITYISVAVGGTYNVSLIFKDCREIVG